MVDPVHAWCGEPGSQEIQRSKSVKPEKAEQRTPGVQRRSALLHWSPTRPLRGTDCDLESGAALSENEARRPAPGVGFHLWIQRPQSSSGNYVRTVRISLTG